MSNDKAEAIDDVLVDQFRKSLSSCVFSCRQELKELEDSPNQTTFTEKKISYYAARRRFKSELDKAKGLTSAPLELSQLHKHFTHLLEHLDEQCTAMIPDFKKSTVSTANNFFFINFFSWFQCCTTHRTLDERTALLPNSEPRNYSI